MNETYMPYESYKSHSKGVEMKTMLVNPLDETPRAAGRPAPRLDSLAGKTIGLLDISKWGGGFFFAYFGKGLEEPHGVEEGLCAVEHTLTKRPPRAGVGPCV